MTISVDKECPECGEGMVSSKSYAYGMATGDGFLCENGDCDVVHVDYFGDITYD